MMAVFSGLCLQRQQQQLLQLQPLTVSTNVACTGGRRKRFLQNDDDDSIEPTPVNKLVQKFKSYFILFDLS